MLTKYLEIFNREAQEQLALLQSGLLALEKRPSDRGMLHELLRNAHTLKGSARMVGLGDIAAITHKMEEQLKEMEEGTRPVDTLGIDRLLKGTDAVSLLTAQLSKGGPSPIDVASFLVQFEKGELTAPVAAEPPTIGESSDTVRAKVATLDAVVGLIGEMIINRKKLEAKAQRLKEMFPVLPAELVPVFKEFHRELEDDILYQDYLIQELHGKAMGLRMLPLKSATDGFERMVRDLALEQGKEVRLELVGGAIDMDRVLLETLKPSLLHIVTNAICHGIETAAERTEAGKPPQGTVRITAQHEGSRVAITIRDDGRGIDPARIRKAALSRGLIEAEEAARLSDEDALYLTLRPGFSTKEVVTDTAGRGVGMDVVKKNVDRVKGNIVLKSEIGSYSEIVLQLPLTLSLIEALLVEAGGETYAIPASYVQEIVTVRPDEVTAVGGRDAIRLEGATAPLAGLAELLDLPGAPAETNKVSAVVLRLCDRRIAVTVDRQLGNSEVVVKGLGGQFHAVRFVFGATILADGNPALILDVPDLFARCDDSVSRGALPFPVPKPRKKVLVVDDSITTRTLEQSILTTHGYEVTVAVSGEDALAKVPFARFDLVISDIEMPGINGFELTRTLKEGNATREIPVIVVSSLCSDHDKRQALEAGAQAYIVKGEFDQGTLLEAVEMLIG